MEIPEQCVKLFKVKNRIKSPQLRRSGVFIVDFEQISLIVLGFQLFTFNELNLILLNYGIRNTT